MGLSAHTGSEDIQQERRGRSMRRGKIDGYSVRRSGTKMEMGDK